MLNSDVSDKIKITNKSTKTANTKILKKSQLNKGSMTKVGDTKNINSSSKISARKDSTDQDDNATSMKSGHLGITALIAIMEPATEGQ